MTHILLIEDEVKLARFIESELNYEGYQVSIAYDGLTALTAVRELHLDLVILDLMLPGLSGLEICHRLRSIANEVPIILLTVKDQASDGIAGLDAGADDYVVKPFNIDELLARVRIHLQRRHQANTVDILEFEDLSLNRRTRQVYRCQRLVELTTKEFDLLEYFLIHPRQVITCDRILEEVWGYHFMGDTNVIEPYIRYLRLKLEANNEKCLIQTVTGVGYTLCG
ncbi:MAG: response regulator transcription factor [Nostoc sp. GBBB01]|jgi:DNA-binding response OmpR family regulator|uniref:Response regulator transcription factor n=1 Tax=Nostoc punctiforme FACHB-252 TaxID=1357509 RepID=A0ABR8HNI5_NOSPU|nr:response regulator transcription factor [Nostoc punctiforme]MBD2616535.1 response regulator transcription factor [Nostoc punctiforme FACHB-252]MBL1200935.1 response regulator transcription factor [Nostoc sp. GBBB01]